MANQSHRSSTTSAAALILQSAGPLVASHHRPVSLELDVPADLEVTVAPAALAEVVTALVAQSLAHMPEGGELSITGWEGPEFCELEIADTGSAAQNRPRRLPVEAARVGAHLTWQNCPQGGTAVTVRFLKQDSRRRAA